MPTYEYRCAKCGEDLEVYQSFSETPLSKHKGCGGKLAKVLSPAGIVLKGSGFYKNRQPVRSQQLVLEARLVEREQLVVELLVGFDSSSDSGKSDSGKSDSGKSDSASPTRASPTRASRRRARPSRPEPASPRFRRVQAEIGIFGGSGFYRFLDDVETVEIATPFGAPSAPVTIGVVGGRRVAFMPRHGLAHEFAPARVPARANLWAMRTLGVHAVIGPCAAGSLSPSVHPGDFVVLDQLVDRTWGRADTFYDAGAAHHVSYADPYCGERVAARRRGRTARRRHDARTRHRRRDSRPPLLDPRRVALVPRARLGRREHDAVPGGVPRPRARHALRGHRVDHRLRHGNHRRSRMSSPSRRNRSSRSSKTTCTASAHS